MHITKYYFALLRAIVLSLLKFLEATTAIFDINKGLAPL
tara:strand:- start:253 stop:369 length:117 start_codon:yes stop_codon:yes gene_type:complete